MPFKGKVLQEMGSRTEIGPQGLICPHPLAIYMYVNIQTSSALIPLGQSKLNFMCSINVKELPMCV